MSEIKIPFGLCSITYDGVKLPSLADEATFSAVPTYTKLFAGALNNEHRYILESYEVTLTVRVNDESYKTLKLMNMKSHENGMYDSMSNVDTSGKKLVIHPEGTDSKDFDICIWKAYISPETGFNRIYKKEVDEFEVVFIGKMITHHTDSQLNNSYFFIGDWEKVGDSYD